MTAYDIIVPALALAVAIGGGLLLRWEGKRLDARLEAEDERRR